MPVTVATTTAAKLPARTFFTLRILPGVRTNLTIWYAGIPTMGTSEPTAIIALIDPSLYGCKNL